MRYTEPRQRAFVLRAWAKGIPYGVRDYGDYRAVLAAALAVGCHSFNFIPIAAACVGKQVLAVQIQVRRTVEISSAALTWRAFRQPIAAYQHDGQAFGCLPAD